MQLALNSVYRVSSPYPVHYVREIFALGTHFLGIKSVNALSASQRKETKKTYDHFEVLSARLEVVNVWT
jgi:hypothetical protein